MFNAFANKDENPELPDSDWDYTFSEQNGKTKVSIKIYNESLARMEKMIEMGFTEGFQMSMNNLENLLATFSQKMIFVFKTSDKTKMQAKKLEGKTLDKISKKATNKKDTLEIAVSFYFVRLTMVFKII